MINILDCKQYVKLIGLLAESNIEGPVQSIRDESEHNDIFKV